MELNRDQIIKALECCSDGGRCNDCPYDSDCFMPQWVIVKDALALIRELTEDNKAQAETIGNLIATIKDVQADTVNKMYIEIKERCIKGGIYPAFVARTIAEVAKELLEDGK